MTGGDRSHWLRYDENMAARDIWTKDLLDAFKEDVRKVREVFSPPSKLSPGHIPDLVPPDPRTRGQQMPNQNSPSRIQGQGQNQRSPGSQGQRVTGPQGQRPGVPSPYKSSPNPARPTKLLENSVIVRLEDFYLYRVSTARDNKRNAPKKFLSSDKKQLLLPPEMSSIHLEYTDYFFPDGQEHPSMSTFLFSLSLIRLVYASFLLVFYVQGSGQ